MLHQFVWAGIVPVASSNTYACVDEAPMPQEIHCKKIGLAQGLTHGAIFWQVVHFACLTDILNVWSSDEACAKFRIEFVAFRCIDSCVGWSFPW